MKTNVPLIFSIKLPCALVLVTYMPLAHAAGLVTPGAGAILQQIEQGPPPEPLSTGTGLTIQPQGIGNLPVTEPIQVNAIKITGNTTFTTETLHLLVMNSEGLRLTLSQINELAARITVYYQNRGYPLTRAIIPAQTIQNGVVNIEVIEARYGKVLLENTSRVNDGLIQKILSPLQAGQLIEQSSLDHHLLLLSDIPGLISQSSLGPGELVGTSDLSVQASTPQLVVGSVALDNYGNTYTGRVRAGGTVSLLDPLHNGDVLNLSGLSSGRGMNYADINYESLINGSGTRLGAGYSALKYILGGSLANLNGDGTAGIASVWVKQSFLRNIDSNVNGKFELDNMQLQDNLNNNAIQTPRSLNDVAVSLSGDYRNHFLSGGVTTWNLLGTAGQVGFNTGLAQQRDAVGLGTQGSFVKWNGSFNRVQNLNEKNGLYVSVSGQWANTNLDPSQQMLAGGPYSVRAYDMGVLSGDSGYLGTLELRHQMGMLWNGQWQAIAFADSEHLTINANPGKVIGVNSATLSGAGLGLNWAGAKQLTVATYIATPIGVTPSLLLLSGRQSVLSWVQVSKGF